MKTYDLDLHLFNKVNLIRHSVEQFVLLVKQHPCISSIFQMSQLPLKLICKYSKKYKKDNKELTLYIFKLLHNKDDIYIGNIVNHLL